MLVLPAEPVSATTVVPRRSTTARARAPSAAVTSSTTIAGTPTGRVASTATAPASTARCGEVVAVDALAGEGGEQAAGLHLAGVDDDGAGDLGGRIRYVVRLPADDFGDLGEGEGDHLVHP